MTAEDSERDCQTRAPIANPPNSAQLGGIPYHSSKLHPGPCNSVGMRPLTDRHTDTHTDTRTRVTTIHFASSTTHAKCNNVLNSVVKISMMFAPNILNTTPLYLCGGVLWTRCTWLTWLIAVTTKTMSSRSGSPFYVQCSSILLCRCFMRSLLYWNSHVHTIFTNVIGPSFLRSFFSSESMCDIQ